MSNLLVMPGGSHEKKEDACAYEKKDGFIEKEQLDQIITLISNEFDAAMIRENMSKIVRRRVIGTAISRFEELLKRAATQREIVT